MPASPAALVIQQYAHTHQVVLNFLQKRSDDQLRFQLTAQTHAIAWHAWHLGRWADYLQASLPGMTPALARLGDHSQLWHTGAFAVSWGFVADELGYHETGMDMPDAVALHMAFPAKDTLLGYVSAAFTLAEARINSLTDAEFQATEQPQPLTEGIWAEGTVGNAVLAHVTHDNRHLGMMECLLGLQGQRGSATR